MNVESSNSRLNFCSTAFQTTGLWLFMHFLLLIVGQKGKMEP
jgi:hypothetical protein